jgi:hypothetical protein
MLQSVLLYSAWMVEILEEAEVFRCPGPLTIENLLGQRGGLPCKLSVAYNS